MNISLKSNQKRLVIIILMTLALLYQTSAFAWDNNITHPGLTNKAVDLLTSTDSSYSYLQDYAHFNLGTDTQLTFLDEGSVKEDYGVSADWDTGVWGSQQDGNVPSLSWKSHGYHPVTGEVWYGLPDIGDNAYIYSGDIWADIISSDNPYFHIGRLSHIIEDMASIAHANADQHTDCDDLETYSASYYNQSTYSPQNVSKPSTDGLSSESGLIHPEMTADNYQNFVLNVVWRAYYMSTFQGGNLVLQEGDSQPDSELKRMFPYNSGSGLRYDDGGWFTNDSWRIDAVGYSWIGYGIGNNSDWWPEEGGYDPGYYYFENIDGNWDSCTGGGATPAAFKVDKFRRVLPSDNLNEVLAANSETLMALFVENLYQLSSEWVAGFIQYAADTVDGTPPPPPVELFPEVEVTGNGNVIADGDTQPSTADNTDFGSVKKRRGTSTRSFSIINSGEADLTLAGSPVISISGSNASNFTVTSSPATSIAAGGSTTFQVTFDPSIIGLCSATISIMNNDSDEAPYDFAIQGTGSKK